MRDIILWHKCDRVDCNEEYIGESGKTFGEIYKEHLRATMPIQGHQTTTGHLTTMENFNIIGRVGHGFSRITKEYIYIRVNQSSLNQNVGKHNPHIWDGILINTPELQIKHL